MTSLTEAATDAAGESVQRRVVVWHERMRQRVSTFRVVSCDVCRYERRALEKTARVSTCVPKRPINGDAGYVHFV